MNAGSQKSPLAVFAAKLLLISLGLAGCSNSNDFTAPVSSVSVNSSMDNTSIGMLITSPPKMGIASPKQNSAIQPSVQDNITHQPRRIHKVEQTIKAQDSSMVYNRHYVNIIKGGYIGNTYTVKHGDTLFYISWITGNDFRDLAQRNNIHAPYRLKVGQKLQVGTVTDNYLIPSDTISAANISARDNSIMPAQKSTTLVTSQSMVVNSRNSGKLMTNKMLSSNKDAATGVKESVKAPVAKSTKLTTSSSSTSSSIFTWRWPTEGKLIENFSSSDSGNKGIDIAGNRGQAIVATADGCVVYVGNALRGYGNLIIIKNNDDYLSAYAHNDSMLVREQQKVKAGQKIATMGSTGTSSPRLHFEIRYKGKSVNPLQYLPRR